MASVVRCLQTVWPHTLFIAFSFSFSWDLAVFVSFAFRSRFCCAFAPLPMVG